MRGAVEQQHHHDLIHTAGEHMEDGKVELD